MKAPEELSSIELLDEFEELIKEQARKPKTFDKTKKPKRLELIYEEVLQRFINRS